MDTTTVLLIAIPVLVVLAAALLFAAARRRDTGDAIGLISRETRKRDRGTVAPGDATVGRSGREVERAAALERREPSKELAETGARTPAAWVPPDPDLLGVTRRQFLNRGIVTFMGLSLTGFGAAVISFLWPRVGEGFGASIPLGSPTDVDQQIADASGFAYFPAGRMYVTSYPREAVANARGVFADAPGVLEGMEAGYVAIYQKCPHLGCRVPECVTSQWFECPCHGSQYNQAGEWKAGPAPRGMDRFPMSLQGNTLVVDTGTIVDGPPKGTNTTGQEAEGPNCIAEGGDH